ncbi:hypothetical protein BJV74DRAFT_772328 [Russula compacta]|nr:hypothetical protein BJV74DRAFT_772328 [Russula compacta]
MRPLQKCEADLTAIHNNILHSQFKSIQQFIQAFEKSIKDYDFKPSMLILVCSSSIKSDLGCKSKPCYVGPMVVIHCTPNSSYCLAKLDGAISKLHFAAFCLIPYYARSCSSIPITCIINCEDLMQIHLDKDQDNPTADLEDGEDDEEPHPQAVKFFCSSLTRDGQDFDPLAGVRKPSELGSDHGGSRSSEHPRPSLDQLRLAALQCLSATSHIGFLSLSSTLPSPQLQLIHHPHCLQSFPL